MDFNNTGSESVDGSSSAVSIFGQSQGANDFPVLKAFQEYVDAEQAKARKRMLGLSIFFVVLLVIVVLTFTVIVVGIINRNQSLQDRLLEAALKPQTPVQQYPVVDVQTHKSSQLDMRPVLDRIEQLTAAIATHDRQPVPAVPASTVTSELKPVLECIERLTTAISHPKAAPAPVAVTVPAPAPAPAANDQTLVIKKQLEHERAQLAAERKKLKEEQHQAEVERNRRRLYPEYYAKLDAEKGARKTLPSPSRPDTQTQSDTPALPATGNLDSIKPVGYFDRNAAAEDAELAELAAQAAKRRAASEAARKQAEADAAEAAKRKALSDSARKEAEADEAEAAKRKAAAQAARVKSEAVAAEAAKAKADAQAATSKAEADAAAATKRKAVAEAERKRLEAEVAETKRAAAEAEKRKAEAAKLKVEREFPPHPKTETISVGGNDSSVPWIIQQLSE